MFNILYFLQPLLFLLLQSNYKQVASYSISEYGNSKYENFGFWISDTNKPVIEYTYGKKSLEVPVKYLGKCKLGNNKCFKMLLNNKITLYVSIEKHKLRIKSASGNYNKLFAWQYDGPINGIGMYCEPCTHDEEESEKFLSKYYL